MKLTTLPFMYSTEPAAGALKSKPRIHSEAAYIEMRKRILLGQLPPGEKLKIDVLQKEFALSSTPLREALNRLTAEGLVVSEENRGFRTAPLTHADLRDITRLRVVLEADALTDSIARGDAKWQAAVVAAFYCLELHEKRLAAGETARDESWTALHKAFHMSLLSACSYPRVLATCDALFDQSERYRRYVTRIETGARDIPGEHKAIMDAALDRDVERARHALVGHLAQTGERVAKILEHPELARPRTRP